jgi:predicted Zn-dependent peptidase
VTEQAIKIHRFDNGLTLVAETMAEVASAAFTIMTPAGVARDPESRTGTASVLSELLFRGAGEMDNRTLNERLDALGLQRSASVGLQHTHFSGALVGENLLETLEIYGEILTRPHLQTEQFEMCRQLALQTIESYDDDPRQKISLLVHEDYLPYPLGRPAPGKIEELENLTIDETKAFWKHSFTPDSTIIAVAGKIDFKKLKVTIEQCFSSWQGQATEEISTGDCSLDYHHHENDGAQVHIGVMYPSVSVTHDDYYKALGATSVLSGGMGSRLFTEVREKRALCYSVAAGHRVLGPFGAIQCYLGSSPEQAQEGLDVMLAELKKLGQGISQDELDRAIVGLRASLIMMGESTNARAARLVGDLYHLGRIRSLNEIEQAICSLSVKEVLDHVNAFTPKDFSVTTLGPCKLIVR